MNYILTSIMTKTTGSALSDDVGGRIFFDEAPPGSEFPYVVFRIINVTPDDTFKNKIDDILIQFSLFSISQGVAEITDMYNDLKTLCDDCVLTITGYSQIWMIRQNLVTMVDEITTPAGTSSCKHWAVDYSLMVES